jgi:hypothetical protein
MALLSDCLIVRELFQLRVAEAQLKSSCAKREFIKSTRVPYGIMEKSMAQSALGLNAITAEKSPGFSSF